jgi:nucleoside kinase
MGVLTTGYPSIDHMAPVSHSPAVGETARILAVPETYTFGGCGANIAVALSKLGVRAGVAMVQGDDVYAADYLQYLAQCGVNTDDCECLAGEKTAQSYLFLNQEGQYQNFFFPGAADAWQGQLTLKNLDRYRYAVVTVGQLDYNVQFIQCVRDREIPLVWVMKADVYAYPADMLALFLSHSRYIIMNHIEANYVMQACGATDLVQLLNASTQAFIVTQGAEDVLIYTASQHHRVNTVPPSRMVDPTGAGDGFAAGFLAGLMRNASAQSCARLGSVVASFVLEAVGCQTNLPSWEQTMQRYTAHFGEFGKRI